MCCAGLAFTLINNATPRPALTFRKQSRSLQLNFKIEIRFWKKLFYYFKEKK
jgi:hypothetical protein